MRPPSEGLKPRRTLRISAVSPDATAAAFKRAIAGRICVRAVYNKGAVKLAPYVLYTKDDALFVDAVTLERDGVPPREAKLGAFRLSGLTGVRMTAEPYEPMLELEQGQPRYASGVLAIV